LASRWSVAAISRDAVSIRCERRGAVLDPALLRQFRSGRKLRRRHRHPRAGIGQERNLGLRLRRRR
jgi:hypothetical protein